MQTTPPDPVIAEVHAIRDEYAACFDHDVGRIFRDLRAKQKASKREYVCYPARRIREDIGNSPTPQ